MGGIFDDISFIQKQSQATLAAFRMRKFGDTLTVCHLLSSLCQVARGQHGIAGMWCYC